MCKVEERCGCFAVIDEKGRDVVYIPKNLSETNTELNKTHGSILSREFTNYELRTRAEKIAVALSNKE